MTSHLDGAPGSGTGTGKDENNNPDDSKSLWETIAPATVQRFASSPIAFILGAVLNVLLGGLQTVWESLITALFTVFVGSAPGSTDGVIGIVDLPVLALDLLLTGGAAIGDPITGFVSSISDGATSFALQFGMLSPLVITLEAVVAIVAVYVVLRTLLRIVIDIIPGGGALL